MESNNGKGPKGFVNLSGLALVLILSLCVTSVWSQPAAIKGDRHNDPKIAPTVSPKSHSVADELDSRIKLASNRIVFGDGPKLTEDFLLAGVTLDPQFARRFTEFSGDQCGRYLSAFSRITVPGNPVNLYAYSKFKDAELAFTLSKASKNSPSYTIRIDSCGKNPVVISLRNPNWSNKTTLFLNGKIVTGKTENGYLLLEGNWKKGDQIRIDFDYRLKLTTTDHHSFALTEMAVTPLRAALQYGPYLLGVDDATGLSFMAEPSQRNVIYLPSNGPERTSSGKNMAPASSNLADAYLEMPYKHEGYYSIGKVIMRPISEITHVHQTFVQLWFNFEKR